MIKQRVGVDLFFLEWDELPKFISKELIIFNDVKPWLGFNQVTLSKITDDNIIIKTRESFANIINIKKEDYLIDYKLSENLFWHGREGD